MQRPEVMDLGPVSRMTTNRVGPLVPRFPKMRSNPPSKMEPIVSVTLEKTVKKKPIRKSTKIEEENPKERLIELPPPILKDKKSTGKKPKGTGVTSRTPRKRTTNQKEPPTKFTGKETVKLKPAPPAIPKTSSVVKEATIKKKITKSLAPQKVRWR